MRQFRPEHSNAKRKSYNGYNYQSGMEADYARRLDVMMSAQDPRQRVKSWRRQVGVDLKVGGKHICRYYVDFVVVYEDGREEWVEVKGFASEIWLLKSRLFEAIYPERMYVIVR